MRVIFNPGEGDPPPNLGKGVLYFDRLGEPLPVTLNDGTPATVQRYERRVLGVVDAVYIDLTPAQPSEDA